MKRSKHKQPSEVLKYFLQMLMHTYFIYDELKKIKMKIKKAIITCKSLDNIPIVKFQNLIHFFDLNLLRTHSAGQELSLGIVS